MPSGPSAVRANWEEPNNMQPFVAADGKQYAKYNIRKAAPVELAPLVDLGTTNVRRRREVRGTHAGRHGRARRLRAARW